MAESLPPVHFEDVPIEIARTMGRGPRMDPGVYHALKEKIHSLDNTATRLTIPEGTGVSADRVHGFERFKVLGRMA